jgi:exonuclease III
VRVATWNVNSLKARLDKLRWWLERAAPDVLLLQETKLGDAAAPRDAFRDAGYELAHHGEGRWNGVAIASRCGLLDVVTNFGRPLARPGTAEAHDDEPLAEVRHRIDHLLVTGPLCSRVVDAEIDREARKGKPVPSDHAPLFLDLDVPGRAVDAGWASAEGRIAARRAR